MQIYMKDGKALKINGGGYLAPKASGETWVLNESILVAHDEHTWNVTFTSNGTTYTKLTWSSSQKQILIYDSTVVYKEFPVSSWLDQAYRTITFDDTPTGELLTWLQANGTKQ